MSLRRAFLVGFLLLLAAAPAHAATAYQAEGSPTAPDLALASDYQKVAEAFGDFQLAYVKRTPKMLEVRYILPNEKPGSWSQMVMVRFSGTTGDADAQNRQMAKMISDWNDLLDGRPATNPPPHKISFQMLRKPVVPPQKFPAEGAIFQYTAGNGNDEKDTGGIIHAFPRPTGIVVFQLQKRHGQKITDDDMKKLQGVLNWALSTLNAPLAAKAAPAVKAQ